MTERTRAEWWQMAHKWHVATDGTCYPQYHRLCPHCNPHLWTGEYDEYDEPIPTALNQGGFPCKPTAPTATAPVATTTAKSAGPVVARVTRAEA